jgi:hypothetical protein
VDELYACYHEIEQDIRRLKAPFWYALLANITEVAAIYVVYIAFGRWVNVGAIILAYAVANFAGLVSVLPGGVGIYEALMTAVLATTGVSAVLSLPVTVMYRVINTLVQVPPGCYLYERTLGRSKTPSEVCADVRQRVAADGRQPFRAFTQPTPAIRLFELSSRQ